jgi:hypothetical protein
MYKSGAQAGGGGGGADAQGAPGAKTGDKSDDVIDAEYVDADDKKKQ